MKYIGIDIALLIFSVAVIGCGSDDEVQTTLHDTELVEHHELKPIIGGDISQEKYEAALSLVDNESEDSKFQYSTDENEIDMLQRRNANFAASKSGEAFDIMVADFGGFQNYADFVENPEHSAEYLREVHNRYGIEYIDATEYVPHDSEKDNTDELGPMVRDPEYIGLSVRDASIKALESRYINIRIVKGDDEYLPVTDDCQPGRLNLWTSNSVVIDAKEDQC